MFDKLKRITIYVGNLGSGKTEVAVNTAMEMMRRGKRTVLVDLDIINPYFRTRMVRKQLEESGLDVVSPEGRFAFSDLPAVSPAVKGVILNQNITGVFDVGGDDVGAVALGQYREMLFEQQFRMLFVINTCRPFTRDTGGILSYIQSIREASGIEVSGLVSNSNLGAETDLDNVLEGFSTVSRVAGMLGLPVVFTAVKRDLYEEARRSLKGKSEVLPLDKFMKNPWDQ